MDCATVGFENTQEIDEAISNTNLAFVSYRDIYYAPSGFDLLTPVERSRFAAEKP